MKTRTVEANFGTRIDKVHAGTVDLLEPETFADCVELFGSEKKTIELAIRSYIIDERAKLKARPKKPMTALEKLFAAMTPAQQARALEKLREVDNMEDVAFHDRQDSAESEVI